MTQLTDYEYEKAMDIATNITQTFEKLFYELLAEDKKDNFTTIVISSLALPLIDFIKNVADDKRESGIFNEDSFYIDGCLKILANVVRDNYENMTSQGH